MSLCDHQFHPDVEGLLQCACCGRTWVALPQLEALIQVNQRLVEQLQVLSWEAEAREQTIRERDWRIARLLQRDDLEHPKWKASSELGPVEEVAKNHFRVHPVHHHAHGEAS